MLDRVETRFDVGVQHPAITLGAETLNLRDRVVRPPHRPKPIRDRREVGLENGFQHQLERRLNDPVGDGGNTQPSHLSAATRFGDDAFPYWQRAERTRFQLGS